MTDDIIQVPYRPAAEAALLGGLLIDPEKIKDLALTADEFYITANRWVFEAIQAIRATGAAADYVTLCSHLAASGKLAEIGGPAKIMGLLNDCPNSMHVESYAALIREAAKRRRVIDTANKLAQAAYDQDSDLPEAVSKAMDNLSRTNNRAKGAVHISTVVSEVYDEVDAASKNPKEVYGITTGFIDWDNITHGLQRGTVVKITGEPGVGKSLIAMQILAAAAKAGHPGALYELEMKRGNVVRRLLSGESKIPTYKMLSGKLADDDWLMFTHAVEVLSDLPVYIEANSQLTTADIRADIHRLKALAGIELVVIDYESLLNDFVAGRDETGISIIRSSRVHGIATDLDVAVISLDDMNKEGIAGTKPGMTGVSGGARKLHDADEIIMMRRDKVNPQKVMLTWEKNREGQAKRFVELQQQTEYPAFVSPTKKTPAAPASQYPKVEK